MPPKNFYTKFNGKIDRRTPSNEGKSDSPVLRENWLSRDGRLKIPLGTEKVFTSAMSGIPRWSGRYYTNEASIVSPKTFAYTEDGFIWLIDDVLNTRTELRGNLALNAYPKHQLFKTANQTKMYLVDGVNLVEYDGNNDNRFDITGVADANGNSLKPIDVAEHKDRLWMISRTDLHVSKNLEPTVFDDATDSLNIIVGSGRGENLALGKIEDKLYIFNTEGIFVVIGDVISALAITFEVRLIEERSIIAGRTAAKVEKAIIFMADDYELWSWDGNAAQMLTFELKMKDFVETVRDKLDKASAGVFNNYYQVSFVEKGRTEPNYEVWYDALTGNVDVVKGRNVSAFMRSDSAKETDFQLLCRSDSNFIMHGDRGRRFDGVAIHTKLRTRDLTVAKGQNVRFLAFYPEFVPTGDMNFIIMYHLDGRISQPSGEQTSWIQNLRGETKTLGYIEIGNQSQFTGRVRPKIDYARGSSIAFEIDANINDLQPELLGMGIDFVLKSRKKIKVIGG